MVPVVAQRVGVNKLDPHFSIIPRKEARLVRTALAARFFGVSHATHTPIGLASVFHFWR